MTLLISLTVTLFSYWKMFYGFFQQDEWLAFSYNRFISGDFLYVVSQIFAPSVGHFQPFNTLFLHIGTKLFETNYLPYAILSIFLHLCNVVLVYYLAKKIFKDNMLSFVASIFFGTNSSIHQATSWVMADTGIHLSVSFALLSFMFFLEFLDKGKVKQFVISLVLLVISLLFKETAIAFFAFYPIVYYLLSNPKFKKKHKFPLIVVVIGVVYLTLRASMVLIPTSYSNNTSLVISSQSYFHIFYNLATVPLKAFVQSIIPTSFLMDLSKSLSLLIPVGIRGEIGTTGFDEFVLKRALESLSIFLFVVFASLLVLIAIKSKDVLRKKMTFIFIAFALLNSMIYAFSPAQTGIMSIIASRNLYFISIGTTFLLIFLLRKAYWVLLILIGVNVFLLNTHLDYLVKNSMNRQQILNQISMDNLEIKDKQVFYVESDTSYYGLPEDVRVLPFQSGFGQTLLVWFSNQKDFPKGFYEGQFLWDLASQEYKEIDGRGFGYFRDFNLLKQTLKEYNLPIDSVVAYSWNGKENKLTNITEEIRLELKK